MGEFDDDTASGLAEGGSDSISPEAPPAEIPPVEVLLGEESAQEPAAESLTGESVSADDAIAAIQGQLALEGLEVEALPEATDAVPDVTTDDDLAAAVVAAGEQVGTEGTLSDIAPGTVHAAFPEEIEEKAPVRYGAPWWPFLIYLGLWLAFAGVAVWQLEQLPQSVIVYETEQYTMFVFGGIALAASGVLLVLVVWIGARFSRKRQRRGLFSSALIMGALTILIGVLVWWSAIVALDYLRLGRVI